jgi:hypothetical protein
MSNEKTPPQGAPQAAAGQLDKANGTEVVTVGCKLPNGLICELGKPGDENYTAVRLNGANDARVVGGYGLTPFVSASFWAAWMKKNKGLSFVRKGLVFAHNDEASAADHAKDTAELRSGLEALDPMKKLVGPDGKVLVETDMNHFTQGKRDMAQFGGGRRAG